MVCAPAFAYGFRYVYPEPEDYAIEEAITALEEKRSRRWIPVTERLPKVGIYLVTCDDEKYPVKVMRFKESEDTLLWYTNRGIYDGRIYAWMPLPEPYKKRGE